MWPQMPTTWKHCVVGKGAGYTTAEQQARTRPVLCHWVIERLTEVVVLAAC